MKCLFIVVVGFFFWVGGGGDVGWVFGFFFIEYIYDVRDDKILIKKFVFFSSIVI